MKIVNIPPPDRPSTYALYRETPPDKLPPPATAWPSDKVILSAIGTVAMTMLEWMDEGPNHMGAILIPPKEPGDKWSTMLVTGMGDTDPDKTACAMRNIGLAHGGTVAAVIMKVGYTVLDPNTDISLAIPPDMAINAKRGLCLIVEYDDGTSRFSSHPYSDVNYSDEAIAFAFVCDLVNGLGTGCATSMSGGPVEPDAVSMIVPRVFHGWVMRRERLARLGAMLIRALLGDDPSAP